MTTPRPVEVTVMMGPSRVRITYESDTRITVAVLDGPAVNIHVMACMLCGRQAVVGTPCPRCAAIV